MVTFKGVCHSWLGTEWEKREELLTALQVQVPCSFLSVEVCSESSLAMPGQVFLHQVRVFIDWQ